MSACPSLPFLLPLLHSSALSLALSASSSSSSLACISNQTKKHVKNKASQLPPLKINRACAGYPCTRYRVLATRLSVTRYPLLVIPCPCSLPATYPGHASLLGLTTTVCLPLSLYASGAAFVCLPVNQRFVVALPALTGTYNCLIVNVVVVILENIFTYIFSSAT